MKNQEYIYKILRKSKKNVDSAIRKLKYENALGLISCCAALLSQTNINYVDDDLENALCIISEKLHLNPFVTEIEYSANKECLIFYDGFGTNDRGLIQIYLKSLCKVIHVIYVTYDDRKELLPDVQNILEKHKCESRYINRRNKTCLEQINQLNKILEEFRPGKFFFYSIPNDVVATPIMYAYDKYLMRYKINLTDHSFWLGAKCIDKCIEFRNYGASISKEYRKINEEKIEIIPFYPILHKERKFQGFPFNKKDFQKVVFSGGSLYKTLGKDNKYYTIVDHILREHQEVIFWYAGNGDDTELKILMRRYPGRVFHTSERSDPYQILEHCDVYLNTFPMCEGLLFQLAAMAGCVPVTLKDGNISDGFLLDQESINVEFTELSLLFDEIDKLLVDSEYACKRSFLMKKSVISADLFDEENRKLICGNGYSSFKPVFKHVDTSDLQSWYLDGLIESDIDAIFAFRNSFGSGFTHYPSSFFRGGYAYCKEDPYKVSVIVVTFNSSFERIKFTLDSILSQKGIELEIVIADDGSECNYFDIIADYMSQNGFCNYKLIEHENNQGTVCNFIDGLMHSSYRFVKPLSPGDAFWGEDTLSTWVEAMVASGKGWSFCDVINYTRSNENQVNIVSAKAHPYDVFPYIHKNEDRCRWNYVVLCDLPIGSAIMCTRELLLEYSQYMKRQVKYAEDFIYIFLSFDGEVAYYHPRECILYEYGDGISTCGDSKWKQLIHDDWINVINSVVYKMAIYDSRQRKMQKSLQKQIYENRLYRNMCICMDKGRIVKYIKSHFFPRMTHSVEIIEGPSSHGKKNTK